MSRYGFAGKDGCFGLQYLRSSPQHKFMITNVNSAKLSRVEKTAQMYRRAGTSLSHNVLCCRVLAGSGSGVTVTSVRHSGYDGRKVVEEAGPLFGPPPKERVRQPPAVGFGKTHESHPINMELKGKLPEFEVYKHQQTNWYRELPPIRPIDNTVSRWISGLFWFWAFYHLFYNYEMITGEFVECMPDPTTFTDAQLGIPPDDAADPEYWGAHFDKWDKKLH